MAEHFQVAIHAPRAHPQLTHLLIVSMHQYGVY